MATSTEDCSKNVLNLEPNSEDQDPTVTSDTMSTSKGFYQERESPADQMVEVGTSPMLRTAGSTRSMNKAETSEKTLGNIIASKATAVWDMITPRRVLEQRPRK